MTYQARFGTPHTVETVTEEAIYLPYKTRKEYINTEGERVVIYNIDSEWRVKDFQAFHAEYEEAKIQKSLF